MAQPYQLKLKPAQNTELQDLAAHHKLPYIRERASALLKVAAGRSMRDVAMNGLLTVHDPDTIREWIRRYLKNGVEGLYILPGRGRTPAFSPSALKK